MKFSCENALLQKAVSIAARAVPSKSSVSALEGILIRAEETLRLTGFNLEIGICTETGAEIAEPGSVVLPARLFGEIVRRLTDDVVTVETVGDIVHISCGMSEYNLTGIPADEYPELPVVDTQNKVSVNQKTLKKMISQTVFAVSTNESRPIQTGSLFDVEDGKITIVAVDGYRLALRREETEEGSGSFSVVIPGAALDQVEKISGEDEESITISVGTRHAMFSFQDTVLITRRLEGDFLDYKKSIPRGNPISLKGNAKEMLDCVERVSLLISEKLKSPLRCVFDDGFMKLSTNTAIGSAADMCPVEGNGEGLEIGFNHRYLIDALRNVPDERIILELNSAISPCLILPEDDGDRFVYMVLPVRLRAGV